MRALFPYGTPAGGCPDPVLTSVEALRGQLAAMVDKMDAMQEELDRLRAAGRTPVNGSGDTEDSSAPAETSPAEVAAGEQIHH